MSEENVVLGGRYTLGRVLGQGGMAEVFLAEDVRLHRTVAVKVLRSDLARDSDFQERFRREAQSAAALNHPSIVAVYDTGEEHQTTITGADVTIPYIVMEYVRGDTLHEFIDPEDPMDAGQAGEIMGALLSALEYSHRAGIVHRDIKPGNVMINDAGHVKVMDFGIARAIADAASAMTATQAVMGTAQYLSPEQARGQLVDARSDIYSAACVMYELLTGRPPFTGDTPVSIAYQHVREEPLAPSAYNPAITPAMDAVILTGLAKDRDRRYPSAVAFSRDISAVVTGREPKLVDGAVPVGSDAEATTVLSPVDDATEAIPAITGAGVVGGAAAGGYAATRDSGAGGPDDLSPHSPGELEPEQKRKRPWWLIILVVLAVLGVLAALAWFLFPRDTGPETVEMPGVVSLSQDEARATLEEAGLEPDFTNEDSTEVEADHVISTDPPEGEEVEVGATVSVVLSSGPDSVTVPDDLQGMTREEAAQALEEVGLDMVEGDDEDVAQEANTVSRSDPQPGASAPRGSEVEVRFASGNVPLPDVVGTQEEAATETLEGRDFVVNVDTRPDTDANPGSVLSQTPDADSGTAPYGSTVDLVVAVEPGPVTVPNVTGRTLEDARRILGEEGFGIETEREASDSVEEDQVIRTEPGANEEVERGSTIVIVVSTGPEETPSPTPTETPTDEPTDEPTDDPTDDPTDEPTDDPTDEPTDDPTDEPTDEEPTDDDEEP
ncbi:MAG TPA: Stk1 family PASTA domain-containing Ser/Thr kinase [Candidatus Brachybacterium merdavium]|uniref:non-specific serine/threonine protein kinase n=1 Tax=Candidatus Brachybacterium merdavium TaxID=2838513 RepID=A0A9D2LBV7_9MICO|nr:Stk1 family PASTA domain-containing Ser/Thr kinase [Candidatus Brachybacterium merdavium]